MASARAFASVEARPRAMVLPPEVTSQCQSPALPFRWMRYANELWAMEHPSCGAISVMRRGLFAERRLHPHLRQVNELVATLGGVRLLCLSSTFPGVLEIFLALASHRIYPLNIQ
jgi:hypothetical protein